MIDQPQMTTQHVVQLQRLATGIINGPLSKGLKAALEAAKRALETSGDLVSYTALARAVTDMRYMLRTGKIKLDPARTDEMIDADLASESI